MHFLKAELLRGTFQSIFIGLITGITVAKQLVIVIAIAIAIYVLITVEAGRYQ